MSYCFQKQICYNNIRISADPKHFGGTTMIKLGEKIKSLRKQKNISQEVFANYLGVSFQAVSKWETGNTMPDVTMIPAIASFFGVSTDELFDFRVFGTVWDARIAQFNDDICIFEVFTDQTAGLCHMPGEPLDLVL